MMGAFHEISYVNTGATTDSASKADLMKNKYD